MKKMKKSVLLGILATTIAVGLVAAVVIYHFGFRQRFEVVSGITLRVFYDSELKNEFHQGDALDWGQITDSGDKTMTLYIENTGSVDCTLEFGYDQNQMPGGQQGGWSITWDYVGATVVHGGDPITVVLTLHMPLTIDAGWWEVGSDFRGIPVPPP